MDVVTVAFLSSRLCYNGLLTAISNTACFKTVALVGDHHHRFKIIIHSFVIATANLEQNLHKHSCLWEYRVSLISLQEITPRLMNNRSYQTKATKYAVMDSITDLLLKWWSEAL